MKPYYFFPFLWTLDRRGCGFYMLFMVFCDRIMRVFGFFFQYFPQSRSTETCGGQRGREEHDFGGHKGTDREKRKDIPGNRENEPGAEKR